MGEMAGKTSGTGAAGVQAALLPAERVQAESNRLAKRKRIGFWHMEQLYPLCVHSFCVRVHVEPVTVGIADERNAALLRQFH